MKSIVSRLMCLWFTQITISTDHMTNQLDVKVIEQDPFKWFNALYEMFVMKRVSIIGESNGDKQKQRETCFDINFR